MTEEAKGPEEAQAVAVKAKGRPKGSKGKASKAAMESKAKAAAEQARVEAGLSDLSPAGTRRPAKGGHLRVVSDQTRAAQDKPKARGRSYALAIGADQLTDKQAMFCDGVANGLSLSDAYRAAYDTSGSMAKTVHEAACKLMADSKVKARLEAINREKEEQRRMMAASDASLALATFRRMMESADTDATKVRAAELLAKAAGVFVDKVETTDKTDRTVKDIEQAIAERLKRLGLAG